MTNGASIRQIKLRLSARSFRAIIMRSSPRTTPWRAARAGLARAAHRFRSDLRRRAVSFAKILRTRTRMQTRSTSTLSQRLAARSSQNQLTRIVPNLPAMNQSPNLLIQLLQLIQRSPSIQRSLSTQLNPIPTLKKKPRM